MGSWLYGGNPATPGSQRTPPVSALRVSTSIEGKALALVYGQCRVAGNLIWYGDFYSVSVSAPTSNSGGGGKGGSNGSPPPPTSGTYNYFTSFAVSICQGPITSLATIWSDKGVNGLNNIGFDVFVGDYSQSPWDYLSTSHPDEALAYRGIAYVAQSNVGLGTNTEIPNLSFEVTGAICQAVPGKIDADPSQVIIDLLTNAYTGIGWPTARLDTVMASYSNYCRAAGLLISPAIVEQKECSAVISEICAGTNASPRWSGGVLTIIPWGDESITGNGYAYAPDVTPLYDITEDDLLPPQGASGSDSPIVVKRKRRVDMLNIVKMEYLPRTNNYNPKAITATDQASVDAFGARPSDLRAMHYFCDDDAAQMALSLLLNREQVACTYYFTLPPKFILPDVEDILTLTRVEQGLDRQAVRITDIQENADGSLNFVAEEFLGTASAPLYGQQAAGGYTVNYNVDPGLTNDPIIFEPTDQLGNGLTIWGAVSGVDTDLWGGCFVWASYDNITYQKVGVLQGPARMGELTAVLAAVDENPVGPPTIDTDNTLSVDLSESLGELTSGTQADALALNTACYVGGEIVAYETATLTGDSAYDLTYLVRGAYGTEDSIVEHAIGTPFARLDQGIFKLPYDQSRIGATLYIKLQSFNVWQGGLQDLADLSPYAYVITGAALASPLPSITNLRDAYVDGVLNLYWDEIDDFRPVFYEIRVGANWDAALTLGVVAHPPFAVPGNGTYWVNPTSVPISGLRVYGETPLSLTIAGAMLETNVLAEEDEQADGWIGTLVNVGIEGSGTDAIIRLGGSGNILDETNVLTIDDVLNLGGVVSSGYYEIPASHWVNAGRPCACPITASFRVTGLPVGQNILDLLNVLDTPDFLGAASTRFIDGWIEIAVAQDGPGDVFAPSDVFDEPDVFQADVDWGPWQKFSPNTFFGQMFKFRFVLSSIDPQVIAYGLNFSFRVDVPDRVDHYQGLTIPAGGLAIEFTPNGETDPKPFNFGPNGQDFPFISVGWPNHAGDTLGDYTVTLTKSGVTIQILNGGVGVERTNVNVDAQGA